MIESRYRYGGSVPSDILWSCLMSPASALGLTGCRRSWTSEGGGCLQPTKNIARPRRGDSGCRGERTGAQYDQSRGCRAKKPRAMKSATGSGVAAPGASVRRSANRAFRRRSKG
jgi:hypothetical protein